MVAIKAGGVDSFLAKPDTAIRLAVIYGPDTGLISERCRMLAEKLAKHHGGEIERFDAETAPDTGALFDAATSLSLFGGQQVILVRPGAKQITGVVESILDHDGGAPLIIEASDLKPSSPLRKLAEKHERAVTLPCYVDGAQELAKLIDAMCGEAGMTIEPDARGALLQLIGGDRLATRGELEKLRDYCAGESIVTLANVLAVCGDASAILLDDAVDAVGLGDAARADTILRRSVQAGTAVPAIIAALTRHFLQLRSARIAVEDGATADTAMRAMRPPVFFKRQQAFKRQITQWRREAIDQALERIQAADAATRLNPALEVELASRLLLGLASGAARRR
ncbi:MAG: DNA polymerase III subunit delta [Rhodobiaceae bacterium]|nr:DNA polymerase III subunit delta [Rhodobiaceae bacterium]MCC0012571.1 DNA polymerase III subunit delta [Rhodobiaceae bacterium]MCC0050712.1 DNA polymerase III subunit delta [Rhodobiaceae bacterium]MCC0061778.1 DNA polymerase III subunit delta [Rhodobiaceae bacterium]